MATRTSIGCPRKCKFCVNEKKDLIEFNKWENLPIICDDNLFACSMEHFEKVIFKLLKKWDWCDFNQGLDSRLLKEEHIDLIKKIKKPLLRVAFDSNRYKKHWCEAVELILSKGIKRNCISTLSLIGFDSGPDEAWERCKFIKREFRIDPVPMWFSRIKCVAV